MATVDFTRWAQSFPEIAAALQRACVNGRRGQAYLFAGDNDEDLELFAMGWARTAACRGGRSDGAACGVCRNCQLFQAGTYTEFHRLTPQSKSRIISVDALREFDRRIGLTALDGMLKIGLISSAECMGVEAQNSFLKTLEEPPENTLLILTSTKPRMLLNTIRSRCQNMLLLRNRCDYTAMAPEECFQIFARLRHGAGCRVAMDASAQLLQILAGLRSQAEEFVKENWDSSAFEAVAKDDRSLAKQLEDQRKERIETEYLRRREGIFDSMQAWFQQRCLVAAGVSSTQLPQPELLPYMSDILSSPPQWRECQSDLEGVYVFRRALNARVVGEELALHAFCMQVCRK